MTDTVFSLIGDEEYIRDCLRKRREELQKLQEELERTKSKEERERLGRRIAECEAEIIGLQSDLKVIEYYKVQEEFTKQSKK